MGRVGFLALTATVLLAGCGIGAGGRLTDVIEGVASYRGGIDTGGDTQSVALSGDRAYVFDRVNSDGTGGALVQIIDVSDLTNPQHVADLNAAGGSDPRLKTFQHSNGKTYLMLLTMHGAPEVLLYDLSDPDAPSYVSELDLFEPYGARDAKIVGDVAYIIGDGFAIVDLSNPATPVILGEISPAAYPCCGQGLCLLNHHVFIANGEGGLIIIDASSVAAPEILLTDTQFGWVGDVEVHGSDRLVVCDGYFSSWFVNAINSPDLDPGPPADLLGNFSEPSPQVAAIPGTSQSAGSVCYRTHGVQIVGVVNEIVQLGVLAAPGVDQDDRSWMNDMVLGDNGTPFYAVAHGSEGLVFFEAVHIN